MAVTGRSRGHRISQSQRLMFGAKLRELLTREPKLSAEELVRRTGAPIDMCSFIKRRFREESLLRAAS